MNNQERKVRKMSVLSLALGTIIFILLIQLLSVPFWLFGGIRWGGSASAVLLFVAVIGSIKAMPDQLE